MFGKSTDVDNFQIKGVSLSDHLRFLLALLFDVVEHSLQFGALLVHLLQTLLGNLLLGLQVLQAAALPVQAVLHVLFTKTHTRANTHTVGSIVEFCLFCIVLLPLKLHV